MDGDIPSISERASISRKEWTQVQIGISTIVAKIDQVLELRKEDNRKVNRLEERVDELEVRLHAVELQESKQIGRKDVLKMAVAALGGALTVFLVDAPRTAEALRGFFKLIAGGGGG